MDNLKKRVHAVIIRTFDSINGEIDENWGPDNIDEWDSLNHLNMVLAFDQEFNITLEFDEVLSIEKIVILIKYPIDFEIKYVCTPNIKTPTIPLNKATYLAPFIPIEVLKITGNGKPCFCDGNPTKFAKI